MANRQRDNLQTYCLGAGTVDGIPMIAWLRISETGGPTGEVLVAPIFTSGAKVALNVNQLSEGIRELAREGLNKRYIFQVGTRDGEGHLFDAKYFSRREPAISHSYAVSSDLEERGSWDQLDCDVLQLEE